MQTPSLEPAHTPRWLHRWAVLTVCVTMPLLILGAEVTTKQVGMVDDHGYRGPFYLMQVLSEEGVAQAMATRGLGWLIEHSHRQVGFVVGVCIIVLTAGLWWHEPRPWVRWLGTIALLGVCAQGLLGIFRIELNAVMGRNLALIHGCFAQLVFACLVSVTLVTSRWWNQATAALTRQETAQLRHWSLVLVGLVYMQAVLGALVRHRDLSLGARAHVLTAFAVAAAVAWLLKEVFDQPQRTRQETCAVLTLTALVALQLFLGMESWLSKFSAVGPSTEAGSARLEWEQLRPLAVHPELMRSLHYFVGSLVFAAAVVVALQTHRRVVWSTHPVAAPAGHLEGAA